MILTEHADAATAAYQVGYERPSQFSREYNRLFGLLPCTSKWGQSNRSGPGG